jgi:hypothetical protein
MAFAIYIPPTNFNYQDLYATAASRNAALAVQALDVPNYNTTTSFSILRPPIILVHGMWGDPSDWNDFTPMITDPRFPFIRRATYNYPNRKLGVSE